MLFFPFHSSSKLKCLDAIYHGLQVAWQAGHMPIVLESDSKTALELIIEGTTSFHPYAPLINNIAATRQGLGP